jgi:beta-glucosidase
VSGYARTHLTLAIEQVAQGRVKLAAATVINQQEEAFVCSRLRSLGCSIYATTGEMWADWKERTDLCMIPAGIPYHAPLAIEALRAGAHVFVEKPLAVTTDEVDRIIRAEADTGKTVAVAFQDLYRPDAQMLKRRLVRGEFGKLRAVSVLGLWPRGRSYYARNGWAGRMRLGAGLTAFDSPASNAFAHFINLALYWSASSGDGMASVASLDASLWRAQQIESFDTAVFCAELDSGTRLHACLSHACAEARDATVRLDAEKAEIIWTHLKKYEIKWRDGRSEQARLSEPTETRMRMLDAVLERVAGGGSFICTAGMARPHADLVERLSTQFPIGNIAPEHLKTLEASGGDTVVVKNMEAILSEAAQKMLPPRSVRFGHDPSIQRAGDAGNKNGAEEFPKDFVWGVAASAPQIEGAATADGKGESVWDRFAATPGKILNGDTPAAACDHYHRFRDDFALMRDLGIRHYRLSLAWPRIIPDGDGAINQPGLDYYKCLLDSMADNGITPWVTMFHWDLPHSLEAHFGGWRSRRTVDAFARYADTIVRALGDRISNWFTLNEIIAFTRNAYGIGRNAPGLREPEAVVNQTYHHALLCHGHGVRAVREHGAPQSKVGLVNNPAIPIPLRPENPEDVAAAREVFIDDNIRVHDPIYNRAYTDRYLRLFNQSGKPAAMPGDFDLIALPTDFIGLNIYAGFFVRAGHAPTAPAAAPGGTTAGRLPFSRSYPKTDCAWHELTPQAIYWGARFMAGIFGEKQLYITENGFGYNDDTVVDGEILDLHRQTQLHEHLLATHRAIGAGMPIRGYFLWSFMDNFEWGAGYSVRFGIVHTDYATQRRTPKLSARWYADVLRNNALPARFPRPLAGPQVCNAIARLPS